MKRILKTLLCAALVLALACPAMAAPLSPEIETAAAFLRETGIMTGDNSGNLHLDKGLNRAELAAILSRLIVNQEYLFAEETYYSGKCTFTDVPEWARIYVGYCKANYLMEGYGGGRFGPSDPVTPAAACTVMLRTLGHAETDWDYSTACEKAVSLGLAPAEALTGTEISRGSMALLVYRTMAALGWWDMSGAENAGGIDAGTSVGSPLTRNADGSINVPSDGSRYIPQAGDVIRCDDGTNYTITDVSRYDKSMFASGPLPELPAPTCDWSQFPALELPEAETRHYPDMGGSDYLFVKNLYEMRRMQYTLYNAIGSNSQTWQNGRLVLRSDGTPLARVALEIPMGSYYDSFWPWREEHLTRPFESSPSGLYRLEAWDVYADGIFQYTEYMIG